MDIASYLLFEVKKRLRQQFVNQDKLMNHVYDKINALKDIGIASVTSSNKTEFGIVVRFEDSEKLKKGVAKIKKALKNKEVSLSNVNMPKFYSAVDVTKIDRKDGTGMVYIIYKADLAIRDGLALEHIIKYLLSGEIDDQLKNRIDLSPSADDSEVMSKLKGDFIDVYKIALISKKKLEKKLGKISKVKSIGSQNSKADLVLYTPDDRSFGLSVKLVTEEGREVRFTYNKNLGYGDDKDTIIYNPSGKPWWLVGRQIFASKLGKRKYHPKDDDISCPTWMTNAKEDKPDIYKEAMEEVYEKMREVLVHNLRRMKIKELVEMVNEAHLGKNEERNEYDGFFKLTSDVDGVKLTYLKSSKPDIEQLKSMSKNDIIKTEGAKIIIAIPGMDELTIHGVKFHSNMLSDDRQNLMVKTR
jgi:hypothetical protein